MMTKECATGTIWSQCSTNTGQSNVVCSNGSKQSSTGWRSAQVPEGPQDGGILARRRCELCQRADMMEHQLHPLTRFVKSQTAALVKLAGLIQCCCQAFMLACSVITKTGRESLYTHRTGSCHVQTCITTGLNGLARWCGCLKAALASAR